MTNIEITDLEDQAVPYVEEGEGPAALVLIAAGGVDRDGLGVVAHYLVEEAGFHIVRIGSRGEPDAIDERVADVLTVLDDLGLDHAWVGGHGFGGTIARVFAAEHADRVNGLLLLGVEDREIPLAPVIPVLIVQGTHDDVTPPVNGERLQSTAPERASIKTVDGGHRFPTRHPVETAIAIEEYLDWD